LELTTLDVTFKNINTFSAVIGVADRHLDVLGRLFNTTIHTRGDTVKIPAADKDKKEHLEDTLTVLIQLVDNNISVSERDVIYVAKLVGEMDKEDILQHYLHRKEIIKTVTGKPIHAKTINQTRYLEAIVKNDLVFSVGPAGTGKTYVAILYAVRQLKNGHIRKIILTRPAVEAGESLGFLPGDLKEKIDPYLRPLYDALNEALGFKQTNELIEDGVIEIAPLAYMRGRTLEDAYVVLDEAQNTTKGQMKLFLSRLGFHSKMIVTGDLTQIDLPPRVESGLVHAIKILEGVQGVEVVRFERIDVIRHPLIQNILERYENDEHR